MRYLAVDPGEKRIGIALSDPTCTIAGPFTVLTHRNRYDDALTIIRYAQENSVSRIIVGQALDSEGEQTEQSRKARNLAQMISKNSNLQVEMWDESFSTIEAREAVREMGVSKNKRRGHHDDLAATIILQSYLDSQNKLD